jgi:hypothetical protein
MKNIKIILLILCFFAYQNNWGQRKVTDVRLHRAKLLIISSLTTIAGQKQNLASAYKELTKQEKEYVKKLVDKIANPKQAGDALLLNYVLQYKATEDIITTLLQRISSFEQLPLYFRGGLSDLKADLAREEHYLEKTFTGVLIYVKLQSYLTGGQGYSYNYVFKLLLRVKRIKSKVQEMEYRFNNLSTLTKVLF